MHTSHIAARSRTLSDQATTILRASRAELTSRYGSPAAAYEHAGVLLSEASRLEDLRAEELAKLPPFDAEEWLAEQFAELSQ